jgi:hypothetical protein
LVINTTNIMDSHSDVHLKGICSWTKPALLLQHQMKFNSIISDKVTAKESHKWKDLGFDFEGDTEH